MSNAEISMEYAQMENAAKVYQTASESYKAIAAQLAIVGENLRTTGFKGDTGDAARRYIDDLERRLNDLSARAIEMQSDINKNVASFRGDVDPGIAQRFNT